MRLDDRVSLLVQEKVREQNRKKGINQKGEGAEKKRGEVRRQTMRK